MNNISSIHNCNHSFCELQFRAWTVMSTSDETALDGVCKNLRPSGLLVSNEIMNTF